MFILWVDYIQCKSNAKVCLNFSTFAMAKSSERTLSRVLIYSTRLRSQNSTLYNLVKLNISFNLNKLHISYLMFPYKNIFTNNLKRFFFVNFGFDPIAKKAGEKIKFLAEIYKFHP